MTTQEIFDTVVTHLLTQRKKAINDMGKCVYRTDEGLKCAVGCLITDECYSPEIEGWGIWYLDVTEALECSGIPVTIKTNETLLVDLQYVHDHEHVGLWKQGLLNVASKYGLNPDVLEQF